MKELIQNFYNCKKLTSVAKKKCGNTPIMEPINSNGYKVIYGHMEPINSNGYKVIYGHNDTANAKGRAISYESGDVGSLGKKRWV